MVGLAQRTKTHQVNGGSRGAPTATLHSDVAEALQELAQRLATHASRDAIAAREDVRFFGQVAAAWADVPDDAFPPTGAGFGSAVVIEDLDQGVRETFTLMTGAHLDIDRGQVSLASPIGRALLGAEEGNIVSVQTPHRLRKLRVVEIRTLQSRIADAT